MNKKIQFWMILAFTWFAITFSIGYHTFANMTWLIKEQCK